jgi:RNA polymerase sigma-70 factor (ECF subfamily)
MIPVPAEPPASSPLPKDDRSDHELLELVRANDEQAAAALYFRYAPRLLALAASRCSPDLARRLDSEDIVQSVFGRFFRRARTGDYDVPEGQELWKLLLVIAMNRIRAAEAHHRAVKRDVGATDAGDLDREPGSGRGADDEAHLQLVVSDALERLPERHRELVELRLSGYEVGEIAEMTGRSRRTVERVLQEARAKLDDLLRTA